MSCVVKFLVISLLYIIIVNCAHFHAKNGHELEELWGKYKAKYNRSYSRYHELKRKSAWMKNYQLIQKHNADAENGVYRFKIGTNNLADMSQQMYRQKMVRLIRSRRRRLAANPELVGDFLRNDKDVPAEINWKDLGYDLTFYNQKGCGSCYAFSVATMIAGQIFKQTNESISLSAQQLVDCSDANGNLGCRGGSLRNTLRYVDSAGGIMRNDLYPYIAQKSACRFLPELSVAKISSWAILPARNEKLMKAIVGTIGPVAASINAGPQTFQLYKSGIYDDPTCLSNHVNHAVLIYGYTDEYWLIQNWWGQRWGENGTMRLKINKNLCGIANYVAYVLI